jgi:hypothetical protein
MQPLRLIGLGLTSLCLALSLTACGSRYHPQALPTPIPEEFTEDCPETQVEINYNRDLATKIVTLKSDLKMCNADKAAMRAYNRIIKEQTPNDRNQRERHH